MRTWPWSSPSLWLTGAVLAAAVSLTSAARANGEVDAPLLTLARPSDQLEAIPLPPDPPTPPAWLEDLEPSDLDRLADEDLDGEPAPEVAGAEPEPDPGAAAGTELDAEPPLPWNEPLLDDPRADVAPSFALAVPVPPYPLVINGSVETSIDYFTARERERFGVWIARSGRYLAMIQGILRERGLPDELAYTAMIESGFSPRAVSRAGARGMWQFMEGTARRYGLVVNRWVDERFDPVKSTVAAAQYLSDLYARFGHWFLAQAAYNAGEARVAWAVRRARTKDFWALTQTRYLPQETKRFVPQILAATVITRNPPRYGFDVGLEPAIAYDEVPVGRPLDLDAVAALVGVGPKELRELNPALRGGVTPPFGDYALRVPAGLGARLHAALEAADPTRLPVWGLHKVRSDQSLADIARMYQVAPQRLAEVNHLRGERLRGVRELMVPVSQRIEVKTAPPARAKTRPESAGNGQVRHVVVRRGDTLWGIAKRHGLEPTALARLNGRDLEAPLLPGERLVLAP